MMWFHCPDIKCDKWTDNVQGFDELQHFVKCGSCGGLMRPNRSGTPEDIGLDDRSKTTGTLVGITEKF